MDVGKWMSQLKKKMGQGANTAFGALCDHKLQLKRIVIVKVVVNLS